MRRVALDIANEIERQTGIRRALQPEVCDIAHARAKESITVPGHPEHIPPIEESGDGWGEVLGWNRLAPNPIEYVVNGWMASPDHRKIITDISYPVIGAGLVKSGDKHYFCVIVTTGLV